MPYAPGSIGRRDLFDLRRGSQSPAGVHHDVLAVDAGGRDPIKLYGGWVRPAVCSVSALVAFCQAVCYGNSGAVGSKSGQPSRFMTGGSFCPPIFPRGGLPYGYIHRSYPDRYFTRRRLQSDRSDHTDKQKEVTAGNLQVAAITSMHFKG